MRFELSDYRNRRRCRDCPFGWDRPNDDNNWCDRCADTQVSSMLKKLFSSFLFACAGGLDEKQPGPLGELLTRSFRRAGPVTYILGPDGNDKQN